MNTVGLISQYPFWGPANAGPAEHFASPYYLVGAQLEAELKALNKTERVPQETQYSNKQVGVLQLVPAFVPLPQAPVQTQDPFAQARSLLDYASQSLGSSYMGTADNRGNAGFNDLAGGARSGGQS